MELFHLSEPQFTSLENEDLLLIHRIISLLNLC